MKIARYALVISLSLPIISFAQTAPTFSKGTDYPTYKKALLKDGWTPVKQTKDCGINCQGQRADGLIETLDCGDAGTSPCTFILKSKDGTLLTVHTMGENLVVQKASSDLPKPDRVADGSKSSNQQSSAAPSINKPNPDPIGTLADKLTERGWGDCSAVFLDAQASYVRNQNVSQHNQREVNRMLDILIKVKQRFISKMPPGTHPHYKNYLDKEVQTSLQILGNSSREQRKKLFDQCVNTIYSVFPPN